MKVTGREGSTDYLVNVSRLETDGFRQQSQAEIRQANIVVRNQISPATEIRGVFNYYDSPFAGAPSFLTEAQARETPRMGRETAIAQNWNEVTSQGQGGVTIEHQFSGGPLFRATGWGVGRDLAAVGVGRIIDVGRKGGGFRSEVLGEARLGEWPLTWVRSRTLAQIYKRLGTVARFDFYLTDHRHAHQAFAGGGRKHHHVIRAPTRSAKQMSASLGPFGPGFFGRGLDENKRRYFRRTSA